ncbi:MAG TPA: DUF1801 domain-containing protein [Burkholderiaceae bacterium]|nr:DUF1801 domain-containing protein [Burkholderiaceae bacterium]
MATNKTQATTLNVDDYLAAIDNPQQRADAAALLTLMSKASKHPPVLWGSGNMSELQNHMVGFGQYHYKYASGREGDSFLAGFAKRKTDLTIYISSGFDLVPDLMAKLGKHKASKVCIYIKKLADIDPKVLAELVKHSVKTLKKLYP